MTAPAGPTTVVLARLGSGAATDVREVVRDWTAADLLGPSVWIDLDQPPGPPLLTVVDRDGTRTSPAEQWLAVSGITGARVLLLQVFTDRAGEKPVPAVPVTSASLALLDRIGLGTAPLVNLLVPATGSTPVPEDAVVGSRPNVLLQARDGQSPTAVSRPVPADELAAHAATGLATVAGLWTAMAEAPLDGTQVWPGTQVTVARAYARTLDSQAVFTGLSEQVYRAEGTLPRARTQRGDRLTDVPDVQALPAAEAAATAVLGLHRDLTTFAAPPPYQSPPKRSVGLLQAVRMFLSFLWAAIRNAPAAWVAGVLHRTASGIAGWANDRLFGDRSGYEVLVLGVRPADRAPQSADEDDISVLIDEATRLAAQVSPGTETSTVDAGTFWSDVTTVGVSLADGSAVHPAVHMPQFGQDRQVLDRPEAVVPSPDEPVHRLPVGALPEVGALAVHPDDPYMAAQAERLLVAERDRPASGPGDPARYGVLDGTLRSLGAWMGRQRSFTWALGSALSWQLEQARRTLGEAIGSADETGDDQPPARILETQRRTRSFVLGALAAVVVALLLVVGLVVGDVLSPLIGGLLAVLLLLVWFVGSALVFMRRQKELFTWLHERDERRARRAWAQQHVAHVAREVQRLGVLYRQSRLWTRVLSHVVHDPFGAAGTADEESAYPTGLSGALPLSVAVGSAGFLPEDHAQLVHEARRAQVHVGWLGAQLHARIETALAARSQRYGRAEHRAVWSDTGYSDQGPLPELVRTLGTPEDRRAAAAAADARLVDWLTRLGAERGLEWSLAVVHPTVTVTAGMRLETVPGPVFLSPVLGTVAHLDRDGFSSTGAVDLANQVESTVLAAVGVPVPPGAATQLRVVPPGGRHSMDRFVARLDLTRQLTLDQVEHFTPSAPEVPGPQTQSSGAIGTRS
ncbi:hypothetical protein LY71_12180 [Geodermatophilus tzadiensis]|uniref:Uncharacterized protein n=1 Tax=Geodermatophilus tzadiensis TaxID=1137988 RepID=A0A2T0T167_9ACTN|nr:hypothetical protein [Geodermatophilus tzadiensis]PRY39410.1 hypothetical protein LY71_12180 [Geodermatophilus tzadiensis]